MLLFRRAGFEVQARDPSTFDAVGFISTEVRMLPKPSMIFLEHKRLLKAGYGDDASFIGVNYFNIHVPAVSAYVTPHMSGGQVLTFATAMSYEGGLNPVNLAQRLRYMEDSVRRAADYGVPTS